MARDTLTRDQIVDSAIRLLDEDGLDGLNMRALGKRLDSAATAVYWHIGSKDDLVSLAVDSAWHEIALPDPLIGWREAARTMAAELRSMLARHPWVVHTFGSYLTYGLERPATTTQTSRSMRAAGFSGPSSRPGHHDRVHLRTRPRSRYRRPGYVATQARQEPRRSRTSDSRPYGASPADRGGVPTVEARLETAAADYASAPLDSFEFGLTMILDGLASLPWGNG